MSWISRAEEDEVFASLSSEEKKRYFEQHRQNGGDVEKALDGVVGAVWYDSDGAPKGHRNRSGNE